MFITLGVPITSISFSHSTLRLSSIRHAGPRIWNNLSHDLKVACSLSAFIRKMKSLLIYYYLNSIKWMYMKFMCNININNSSHHLSLVFVLFFSLVFVGLTVFCMSLLIVY